MGRNRRGGATGRFAGLHAEAGRGDDMQNLYILGLPATIFDDESIACSLHEERHLLPWMGDEGTRVDRYDARLLLEDLSAFECSTSSSNYQEEVDPDLEHERYADLDYSKEWQLTRLIQDEPSPSSSSTSTASSGSSGSSSDSDSESDTSGSSSEEEDSAECGAPHHAGHGGYAAVGFSYGSEGVAGCDVEQQQQHTLLAAPAEDQEPYRPRFEAVPNSLLTALPATEKLHKILVETARFVRRSGGQVEVLLRVKQAANPTFSFLMPTDRVYPYYRWIVEHDPQELPREGTPEPVNPPAQQQQQQGSEHAGRRQQEGHVEVVQGPVQGPSLPNALVNLFRQYGDAEGSSGDDEGSEHESEHAEQRGGVGEGSGEHAAAAAAGDTGGEGGTVQTPCAEDTPGPAGGSMGSCEGTPSAGMSGGEGAGAPVADVGAIIKKLAVFVKRSGARFEATIRQKEGNNPAFGFLLPWNPHHAAYRAALLQALGSDQAVDDLLAESAAIVAAAKQLPTTGQHPARSASPALPPLLAAPAPAAPPHAVAAPLQVLLLGQAAGGSTGSVGSGGAPTPAEPVASTAAPQAAAARAIVMGPAPKPILLKPNPTLVPKAKLVAVKGALPGASSEPQAQEPDQTCGEGGDVLAQAVGAPQLQQQQGQDAQHQSEGTEGHVREAGLLEQPQPPQEDTQGQGAETHAAAASPPAPAPAPTDEEIRAAKLRERRQRAREVLAQKAAARAAEAEAKAKEEARQRALAVRNHRHAFLACSDDEGSGALSPALDAGTSTGAEAALPPLPQFRPRAAEVQQPQQQEAAPAPHTLNGTHPAPSASGPAHAAMHRAMFLEGGYEEDGLARSQQETQRAAAASRVLGGLLSEMIGRPDSPRHSQQPAPPTTSQPECAGGGGGMPEAVAATTSASGRESGEISAGASGGQALEEGEVGVGSRASQHSRRSRSRARSESRSKGKRHRSRDRSRSKDRARHKSSYEGRSGKEHRRRRGRSRSCSRERSRRSAGKDDRDGRGSRRERGEDNDRAQRSKRRDTHRTSSLSPGSTPEHSRLSHKRHRAGASTSSQPLPAAAEAAAGSADVGAGGAAGGGLQLAGGSTGDLRSRLRELLGARGM